MQRAARRLSFGIALDRLARWVRLRRVRTGAAIGLVILGPLLAVATFAVLGPFDLGANAFALRVVLLADLVYILALATLVLQRVAQMIAARRARSAGSRLHMRLTGAFAFLALLPAVLVAVFAGLTINVGLEGWFSDRVREVVGSSLAAAEAYEEEHRRDLATDAGALARYLGEARAQTFFMSDGELRQELNRVQPQIQRGLKEAYVIDGEGEIRARGERSYLFDYERPSRELFARANEEGIAIVEDWDMNEFRALVPLAGFADRYLYISRTVDGEILSLLDETQETVVLYQQLESERGRLLFEFGLIYLGFAVILILAATWLGLWFAERLARPVGRLAGAAQRVGAGDLDVRVPEEQGDDEIAMLGRYFNQMTRQLKGQREALLENTRQIEGRRRLFDSVLSSVTSGVVGLDVSGRVTFVNRSAERLLALAEGPEATPLEVAVPEFGPLFGRLRQGPGEVAQEEVRISRGNQHENLLVRMAVRRGAEGAPEGYVVAFDDVTDLVAAQRMAAWGDVARRIAHEIKNPLTPIQLSAERIRRKFRSRVGDESDALEQMTDVIVRQTDDLRRIVDEFSKFARMPEPDRRTHDVIALLRGAVLLQEGGQPGVHFKVDLPRTPVAAQIDDTLFSQALTNLIKNAGEAIESRMEKGDTEEGFQPEIRVSAEVRDDALHIAIDDNGIGLPPDRARLFEPYVTTRAKGTGLGLPIVKKIIEEHGGQLVLGDAPPFSAGARAGARAEIILPLDEGAPLQRAETTAAAATADIA